MTHIDLLAQWIDLVVTLLERPLGTFPIEPVRATLDVSFESSVVAWNWRDGSGAFGIEPRGEFGEGFRQALACFAEADLVRHPLVRWYLHRHDGAPQTYGRVPDSVSPSRERADITDALVAHGIQHQLAIPVSLAGATYRKFVMARETSDYTDHDLALASHLQRLLVTIDRQVRTIARAGDARMTADAPQLTGRELAVLTLLADGASAYVIGRRLAISPRTAQKHLEHVYRKLEVRDRMTAVMVAVRLGLVPPPQLP